jgi:hypothetical protein
MSAGMCHFFNAHGPLGVSVFVDWLVVVVVKLVLRFWFCCSYIA